MEFSESLCGKYRDVSNRILSWLSGFSYHFEDNAFGH